MNHYLSSFVSLCLATISTWHFPTISSFNSHHNDDRHTSQRLDLLINGKNDPGAVVSISDMKPGDDWYIDKDLFVKDSDAKIYVHLKDLVATQGAQTEPEIQEENGAPKSDLQNYLYYDLKVKDKKIISLSDHIRLPDAVSCWIPLGEIKKEKRLTITQSFHFDKKVTNWAQGDILTFTEEFLAIGNKDDDHYPPETGSGRVWSPTLKKCIPKPTVTPKPTKKPIRHGDD